MARGASEPASGIGKETGKAGFEEYRDQDPRDHHRLSAPRAAA
jgi:hypothetical protein